MKRFSTFFIAAFVWSAAVQAQDILKSLEQDAVGQGKVTIHQDARISALVGKNQVTAGAADEQKVIKLTGYRIQVFAGNNTRESKNEAFAVADKIKELFPELPIYTSFIIPRWICRAGDFRSIEEADAMMRRLRSTGKFKEVSIVKDQINIPL